MDEALRDLERKARAGDDPRDREALRAAYRRAGLLPDSTNVRLSSLNRRILADSIVADHDCDDQCCEIAAALENGFVEVAAYLLINAIEAEAVDELLEDGRIDIFGTNMMGERFAWPRDWDSWVEWHHENAISCPGCGAFNYPNRWHTPEVCGNCQKSIVFQLDPNDLDLEEDD